MIKLHPHKLLLTDRQVARLRKVLENKLAANIKLLYFSNKLIR